jgi:short-subunit dehydrogenase
VKVDGSVVLLTGASRGIGTYVADHLARAGADLALVARSKEELEATAAKARKHGVRAVAITADITKRADLKRIVARTEKELGPIDILINNAGTDKVAHFATIDPDMIEDMFKLNVIATEVLTRLVVPGMIDRKRGHILNMSSLSGKVAAPYMTVYSSTKHALVGFSWSLRAELHPYGIGVSVICPGYVTTGLFMEWNPSGKAPAITKPVDGDEVAAKTLDAIENNKAEVIVGKGLTRASDITAAISPDLLMKIAAKSGSYEFLRSAASRNSEEP